MSTNRQPQGIPTGGQFAAARHGEPAVGLRGDLHVDKEAATYFADQVESIQQEGLEGALSAHGGKLTFTSNDGRTFHIHQDGHTDEDGNPGWAIDNHDVADPGDPVYGIRYESRTENLGEDLAAALADADAIEAFTLNAGSEQYDFRSYDVIDGESATSSACFMDATDGFDLTIDFDHDTGVLRVDRNGETLTGAESDDALRDLVQSVDIDAPDGSPTGQMAWHMERSFRIAAAKHDSPAWMHPYRTAGLTWEDRNDGR
ncbi:hypothetical protein Achl_4001 (plasmid) [Pseudarthrobacter chlorophenolicus A6]|uniref:Uncharacterized protein n=1 Tax=Pseudarthrobacter chlorophenolicus (strain ATCC 700700 / DSM 12829 / CIP 107037 / JCM 12360 / KCTC 9906 / NCIMB 13794 / A6) TaxID=452863 RepID=B8HHQ5_PSECP|nr:hypothetical protein [Pseudarthrobacter chlorophenolicus]ACL41952.1 hypothetical protein Achl_4001 [Pseudarthrobacter chlorophenolicus A6]SDQ19364.1 hypothetical protein SAMN04489738_0652 [Pseudarthrobacter chlorophenolicus]